MITNGGAGFSGNPFFSIASQYNFCEYVKVPEAWFYDGLLQGRRISRARSPTSRVWLAQH
jgi:hypothetical protein